MTATQASQQLRQQLLFIYSQGESSIIADWVMQHITGVKRPDRLIANDNELTQNQTFQLQQYAERLLQHEPVQYVLNEALFCGLKFYVDKNVLIPRPETEELVEWIIADCKFPVDKLRILDIGSGSGCIAIALKRKLRKAEVWSCDVSEAALQIAKQNANNLGVDIDFVQLDFLNTSQRKQLQSFDIIVSNPPYVPEKDKEQMQPNVVKYEPSVALFVPNNDALVFYKAIADFGKDHRNKEAIIYVEIHEDMGKDISQIFQSGGYSTELKKDMQGKQRMIKAIYTL